MSICHGCGGVIGRDCFNPQECEMITRQMAEEYIRQPQPQPENLPTSDVSYQRELLKAFLNWQQNICTMPYDASISSQIEAWEAFNSD